MFKKKVNKINKGGGEQSDKEEIPTQEEMDSHSARRFSRYAKKKNKWTPAFFFLIVQLIAEHILKPSARQNSSNSNEVWWRSQMGSQKRC